MAYVHDPNTQQSEEPVEVEIVDEEPQVEIVSEQDAREALDKSKSKPSSALVTTNALGGLPHINSFIELAHRICYSNFVPAGLRGDEGATLACIMHGQEIGLRPMQSLNSIDMIDGRPALKPEAMRALIIEAGHSIRFKERTATKAVVAIRRKEWPADEWEEYTYTIEEATLAGLTKKPNWQKNPADMLVARVTARAARSVAPDVIRGLSYIPEEIEALETRVIDQQQPQQIEENPRQQMQRLYSDLDEQRRRRLKKWWLDSALPKGETWPAGTLADLPEELITTVIEAISKLVDGEVPTVLISTSHNDDHDDDDDIVEAEIVEDESGSSQQVAQSDLRESHSPQPENETAASRASVVAPADAERSIATTRPSLTADTPVDGHLLLTEWRRANSVDLPTAKRKAEQYFSRPISSIERDLSERDAAEFTEYLSLGFAFNEDVTPAQAEQSIRDSFGDVQDVSQDV